MLREEELPRTTPPFQTMKAAKPARIAPYGIRVIISAGKCARLDKTIETIVFK